MKQSLLILLTFLTGAHLTFAQYPVFQSKEILGGEVQIGYYVLLPTEDLKEVRDSWQSFLQKQGRLAVINADLIQTDALVSSFARDFDVVSLSSTVMPAKGFTKVFCVFKSRQGTVREKIDPREVSAWWNPFIEDVQYRQSQKLRALEIEQLKSVQKTLDRDVARLQTAIERNLKQQNKLDQTIRQTPEELSKIIQEKEALTQSLIQQDEPEEELKKESVKKEKDIQKLQAQAKRNEKQLTNKEKALQKLRIDFIKKEKERRLHQEVLESKSRI